MTHPADSPRLRARLLIAALGLLLLYAVAPFVSGLMGAAILYVVCAPAHRRLARRVTPRHAAAVVVVASVVLILLPGAWLLATLVAEAPETLRAIEGSAAFARLAELRLGPLAIGPAVRETAGTLVTWVSGRAFDVVGGAARALLNLVIALFGLYFLLLSADRLWRRLRPALPFSAESAEALRVRFHSVTEAMLLGTALTAVLQGTVVGIGFAVVGLPGALFWGGVTAIATILPVLGSALVWLPAAAVLAVGGRWGAALALVVVGAGIASNIDNIVRPVVYRRVSDIHPMATIVGAFAGVGLFGLVGVLLGPLAISYFFELVAIYEREYGAADAAAAPLTVGAAPHPPGGSPVLAGPVAARDASPASG